MSSLLRRIPTVTYTIQNILISTSTIVSSVSSLLLTATVILPLSVVRVFLPNQVKADALVVQRGTHSRDKRKVVLIVGASRGIGRNVVREYAGEEGTTIIAVSRSMEKLEAMASDIGPMRASIRLEALDISVPPSKVMQTISEWDGRYGPITHVYAISAISNHLDDEKPCDLDTTVEMVNVNIVGTVSVIMASYECMKPRRYGTICVVGSVAGLFNPANMIAYSSTKAFINTFASSLRILALEHNIEVITVAPGFIDTRMTAKMRGQGSTVPEFEFASATGMAKKMKCGVEGGGVGVIAWPVRQAVVMYALRAVNPICEDLGRYISYAAGLAGKKILASEGSPWADFVMVLRFFLLLVIRSQNISNQASIVALLYQTTSMCSNSPLYVMNHKDDNFGDAMHAIARVLQQALDEVIRFLRYIVRFILQIPQMVRSIDFERVGQDLIFAGQQLFQFFIDHERAVAVVLFVFSNGLLHCVANRNSSRTPRETEVLITAHQPRYGATRSGYHFTSTAGSRYQARVTDPLALFAWILMIASVALFIDSLHGTGDFFSF